MPTATALASLVADFSRLAIEAGVDPSCYQLSDADLAFLEDDGHLALAEDIQTALWAAPYGGAEYLSAWTEA